MTDVELQDRHALHPRIANRREVVAAERLRTIQVLIQQASLGLKSANSSLDVVMRLSPSHDILHLNDELERIDGRLKDLDATSPNLDGVEKLLVDLHALLDGLRPRQHRPR